MSTVYCDDRTNYSSAGFRRSSPVRPHITTTTTVNVGRTSSDVRDQSSFSLSDRMPPPPQTAADRSPPPQKRRTATTSSSSSTGGIRPTALVTGELDPVAQDRICTQTILNSRRRDKVWETHWGFVLELDPKGQPKAKRVLPEKVSVYSSDFQNTDSSNYGSRLNSDAGRKIQTLETRFYSGNRRRKVGNDVICF